MNAVIGQEKLVKALEGYTLETALKLYYFWDKAVVANLG